MNITKRSKIVVGALALAGAITMTGGAFTAGGLAFDGDAGADHFIGGSVEQSFVGAKITNVAYDVDDAANQINAVTLTFAADSANGRTPTVVFAGATANGTYTCAEIAEDTSTCTGSPKADTNVTGITITVDSSVLEAS